MRVYQPMDVLAPDEEQRIHDTALRILEEVGVEVQSRALLGRLAEAGGTVDRDAMRVRFGREFIEKLIAESAPFDWDAVEPRVSGSMSIYAGRLLNPDTDRHEPWTLPAYFRCFRLARSLPNVEYRVNYVTPMPEVPMAAAGLFLQYLSLKIEGNTAAFVESAARAPHVLEIARIASEGMGVELRDIFHVGVHMVSPLVLAREQADMVAFFAEQGLPVGIGSMSSLGGSAPVTIAGALALHLAEKLFVNALQRALFGRRTLDITCSVAPLDMRTGMYPYGRPEKGLCNLAMAQLARRYAASYSANCGSADAKRPGVEAGYEKVMNALPLLLASGRTRISCGQLSVDEVVSPIQMILDDEIVSALGRFARGFRVGEESLAFDATRSVGPGGSFMGHEHTVRHFREALWEPRLGARDMLGGWLRSGGATAEHRAMALWRESESLPPLPSRLSPEGERDVLAEVRKVTGQEVRALDGFGAWAD